ncbi:MAG TPA: ABC transporter permease, partial [Gemmatimonadaceae bacterium]|nr:ABC transporter permease [Gemmatimonadaceae bacterium]
MPALTPLTAVRSLRRAPTLAIACAATLAIGVGATTAIFTVLDGALLRPLPFADPSSLVGAWMSFPAMGFNVAPQSLATYFTFKRLSHSIEAIAVFDRSSVNVADARGEAKPSRVNATLTTASLFSILGMPMERGRPFTDAEDVPPGAPVVVISDGLWRTQFGADAGVIGRKVQVDGLEREIIGVTRRDFQYPDAVTQLWIPMALDSASAFTGAFGHQGIVRLKPGVTLAAAQREFRALLPRAAELYPNIAPGMPMAGFLAQTHATVVLHPLREDIIGNFGNVAWIAGAAGVLLLLV